MTCTNIRQRLLASERPDQPGSEVAGHLTGCPACRAWQRRLLRLEQRLSRLPVPECPVPAALLDRLRAPAAPPPLPAPAVRSPRRPGETPRLRSEGSRQKLALAFSLAATLALFALGWWAAPPAAAPSIRRVAAADPWKARCETRMRQARNPQQRVNAVVDLTDEFLEEARNRADEPEQVEILARHVDQLVQNELPRHLRDLTIQERPTVLAGVLKRLEMTESNATRLATAWEQEHTAAARSVDRMAVSVRVAAGRLRTLTRV